MQCSILGKPGSESFELECETLRNWINFLNYWGIILLNLVEADKLQNQAVKN